MASNQTPNLKLCQWEADDEVLRADFNADNAKIDAAVAAKGNCRIICGSYVGTGSYGRDKPNSLNFPDMGKAPAMIFVANGGYNHFWAVRGVGSYTWTVGLSGDYGISIIWSDTGVSWYNTSGPTYQLNVANVTYRYCLLFD